MAWQRGQSRTSTNQWKRLRTIAKQQLPYECVRCRTDGEDCRLELDHKVPDFERRRRAPDVDHVDTLDDVQWLCVACHRVKTAGESKRGRAVATQRRTGKRAPRRHPSDML